MQEPSVSTNHPPPTADEQRPRKRPPSPGKVVLAIAAVLVGVLLIATLALTQLARVKPWVNAKVSEATGRPFEIQGDLSASWSWPQPLAQGWRRWIPGVTVRAGNLVMQNPQGFVAPFGGSTSTRGAPASDAPSMARIENATASMDLWPLMARHLSIHTVVLDQPDIALARAADGASNWQFKPRDETAPRSGWTVDVDRLVISEGRLAYFDAVKDMELQARVQTLQPGSETGSPATDGTAAVAGVGAVQDQRGGALASVPGAPAASAPAEPAAPASHPNATPRTAPAYGVRFELEGRYEKARIKGSGRGGQVISLRDTVVNYPLQIDLKAGTVALSAEGFLANPSALSGLDFDVQLSGNSMADLYDVTGLVLPNTPAFRTRGQLTGSLEPERAVWQYSRFDGKVGQSDLHGDVRYTSGKPRPRLEGSMTSNRLRLADLGPTLGTHRSGGAESSDTANAKAPHARRSGKVLPDTRFAAERWDKMDMDLTFRGSHIIRPQSLPLQDLSVRAVMNNAQLRLAPLTFGVAEGRIESTVDIDGRAAPLKAQIRGNVQGLKLSAMFPKIELMKKSLGRMDGAIALESTGNTLADLLGHGTGEMRLYVREGVLSKQLLELAALNVGSIIVGRLFGDDREVRLRCAVADFTVQDGLARTRVVKMSTEDAIVEATGTIDLASEKLDMRIKPESLEWKFFSLRTPLYVRGTFGDPDVGIEPGPLLLRAGAAVVAAVAAPAALALIPVTVPAAEDDTYCKPLLDLGTQPVKPGAAGASGKASQAQRDAVTR
ncbi:AsmA family protein [Acidovorax sp. RAC01]|uniref:AsmA family protein n=1 Tax=Acidovorax sp. RAC01 TaxID=1842533 RepID=UPI0009F56B63